MAGSISVKEQPLRDRRTACLVGLGFLILLGAFLRLYALGQPVLWIDEVTVVGYGGAEKTPAQIVRTIYEDLLNGPTGQHMPLQYLLANLSLRLCRSCDAVPTPFRVRLPFVLLGILTIPFVYAVAAGCYGRRTGLWAAALISFSFFHVYQSRDATSYAPLLFFLAANLYGLEGAVVPGTRSARQRIMPLVALVIGTCGALASHLSAWFLIAAEGLLLGLAVMAIALRRTEERTKNYFAAAKHLLAPLLLLAFCCLPFLPFILAAAEGGGAPAPGSPTDRVSLPILMYQLAHYGWGRGGGRLTVFAAILATGLVIGLRGRDRKKTVLLLVLCVVPTILFFAVLHRNFFPRYLSASYLPFVILAGHAVAAAMEWVTDKARLAGRWRWMPIMLLGVAIAAWHIGPYGTMFAMKDKLMPFSRIREWIVNNVPDRDLVVIRNGYHLREIPGTLSIGSRTAAFADFPNAGIRLEVRRQRSANARSMMERFPLAPWIEDPDYDFGEDAALWTWIYSDFAHKELLADDTIATLWRYGFSPHGLGMEKGTRFMAYYDRREDVLWRHQARELVYWPAGPNWLYRQTQEGVLLFAPNGDGELAVVKQAPGARAYVMVIDGLGLLPGQMAVRVSGPGGSREIGVLNFEQSNPMELKTGPFELAQGESVITLSCRYEDRLPLLIYGVRFMPVEPGQAQQADAGGAG